RVLRRVDGGGDARGSPRHHRPAVRDAHRRALECNVQGPPRARGGLVRHRRLAARVLRRSRARGAADPSRLRPRRGVRERRNPGEGDAADAWDRTRPRRPRRRPGEPASPGFRGGRRRRSPATAAVPSVVPDVERLRTPPAAGEPGRITWLGHASWLVQLDGTSLLIDPVFGERISYVIRRNGPAPLRPAQLPRIDRTLVSHNHYDHYDRPSVLAAGAPLLTGVGL